MANKPTLILLHGALGSSKSFEFLIPKLEKHFNLITPDFKWHGSRAEGGNGFKMQDLVDDLESILTKYNISNAAVFGFSKGGYVALALALQKPDLFNRIMTLGTKLDWKAEQAKQEVKMLDPEKIQEKVPQFAEHLKSQHGGNWSALCTQTAEMMLDLGSHPLLNTTNVNKLELPVRLGLGDQDHMVSLEETNAFFKALQNGQMQVFPKTKHPIERVNADLLSEAILQFFK